MLTFILFFCIFLVLLKRLVGGPQSVFIQKMVDFFWNVGAPGTATFLLFIM